MLKEPLFVLEAIAQTIFDKKGTNILALDVREVSTMTDYCVIAEGTVGRHVRSLSSAIRDALEPLGLTHFHVEGEQEGDWVVLDYGGIVVHLFIPEMREKYALEELWKESKIVDLKINVSKE